MGTCTVKMQVSKGDMPEIHNKREGDMDLEELVQCVRDIESWIEQKCGDDGKKYKGTEGATDEAIAAVSNEFGSPLPYGLEELLRAHDGGLLIYDFEGFSCSQIV